MLSSEQWEAAKALFDRALDQPSEERTAWLNATPADPVVCAEVASLLAAMARTDGFFSQSPAGTIDDTFGTLTAGARIGAWRVVRLIGHGGVGSVYEAARAEGGFDQRAALKVIHQDASRYHERYADERQIVARLDHPHIARIYDGGLTGDGYPYMAIELVDGVPITVYARVARLGGEARLRLLAQVCDAVDYAHLNLVLHLDIKPGNVLVTRDGDAKLVDFGAGRMVAADREPGAPTMYTPAYAAPEQIAGMTVTTATDVHALGLLLGELVLGRVPGQSVTAPAETVPPLPIRLRGDVEAIVARATAPDPGLRYNRASALRADIDRALAGRALVARRHERGYVAWRTLARYRWFVAGGTALVVSLAGGIIATSIEARRAITARDYYRAEVGRENAGRDYLSLMLRVQAANAAGKPLDAATLFAKSAAGLDTAYARDPARYAQVTEYLIRLYSNMTNEPAAVGLAKHFLATGATGADQVTTARVRDLYAQSLLRLGDAHEAAHQLSLSQAYWQDHMATNAADMARSRLVEGQVKRAQHDIAGAITAYRQGIAEARQTPGSADGDVPDLENSLAIALMMDGSYDEADHLLGDVRGFFERGGQLDDTPLPVIIQNQAAIALARNDLPRAEALFTDSIRRQRTELGPSAAMAAAEDLLAHTYLREHRPAQARSVALDAQTNARRFTGPGSPPEVLATALVGAASALAGGPQAKGDIGAALAATAARSDPTRALALAAASRQDAALGRPAVAQAEAGQARTIMAASGKAGDRWHNLLEILLKR
jgi:non-specific serine/threonine protein kinase/serine/threonine-protein kinase